MAPAARITSLRACAVYRVVPLVVLVYAANSMPEATSGIFVFAHKILVT
jgi:hypothetical protein